MNIRGLFTHACTRLVCTFLAAAICTFGVLSSARAQEPQAKQDESGWSSDAFHIIWGLRVGVLGKSTVYDSSGSEPDRDSLSVRPTYALQFGFGWYGAFFALNAFVAMGFLELEWESGSRSKGGLVDIAVAPRFHHRLGKLPLDAHVAASLGAAIPALDGTKSGLSAGATAGVTYFFARTFGVEVETGVKTTRLGRTGSGPQKTLSWTQWNVLNLSLVATF